MSGSDGMISAPPSRLLRTDIYFASVNSKYRVSPSISFNLRECRLQLFPRAAERSLQKQPLQIRAPAQVLHAHDCAVVPLPVSPAEKLCSLRAAPELSPPFWRSSQPWKSPAANI